MAEEASARRRKPEPKTTKSPESDPAESQDETPEQTAPKKPKKKSTQDRLDDDESSPSYLLDTFRVLTFLVLAYVGLSYLVSSGETYTYGIANPSKYTKLDWWKKQFVRP
jgi:hypothetical protein